MCGCMFLYLFREIVVFPSHTLTRFVKMLSCSLFYGCRMCLITNHKCSTRFNFMYRMRRHSRDDQVMSVSNWYRLIAQRKNDGLVHGVVVLITNAQHLSLNNHTDESSWDTDLNVGPILYLHPFIVLRETKVLASLRICAGSPEPSLLD